MRPGTPSDHPSGRSTAGSWAEWNLRSNALRPAKSSRRPTRPAYLRKPGLVNYNEVASGYNGPRNSIYRSVHAGVVPVARWRASRGRSIHVTRGCPPMGARFRLRASFTLPKLSSAAPSVRVVLTTMSDLRAHPRGQRQQLVLPGHGRSALVVHRGRSAQADSGESVRGGRRVVPHGECQLRCGPPTRKCGLHPEVPMTARARTPN